MHFYSASVVALDVYAFEFSLRSDTHWDASRRLVNWRAHQGPMSGRWVEVVPWDRQGNNNLTNTAYVLSFCRRYRIERPKRLRGADDAAKAGRDSLSVLVARGRAKVSAAAAASDWPKRIRDMQHIDVEDLD